MMLQDLLPPPPRASQRTLPPSTTDAASIDPLLVRRALDLLSRSRRRAQAAHALWSDGHLVESLRLAADAFRDAASALEALDEAPAGGAPAAGAPGPDALRSAVAALRADLERLEPLADSSPYDAQHAALHDRLTRVRARVDRAAERRLLPDAKIAVPWRRLAALGVVALAVAAGVALFPRTRVKASAEHSSLFTASNLVDGLDSTEWLLPNGQTGWAEVRLPSRRTVARVSLLNAHNRYHNDRATREFRVEVFRGAECVASSEGTFAAIRPEGDWQTVSLPPVEADRVRVSVVSYHGNGGGLGEVAVR